MMPSELYESEAAPAEMEYTPPPNADTHLRSSAEVEHYAIHTADKEIGKVVDYIIDDQDWKIYYLVVDCGGWFDSRKVLLSTNDITSVNWDNQVVLARISSSQIKNSPEYDDSRPLTPEYEKSLVDHYQAL